MHLTTQDKYISLSCHCKAVRICCSFITVPNRSCSSTKIPVENVDVLACLDPLHMYLRHRTVTFSNSCATNQRATTTSQERREVLFQFVTRSRHGWSTDRNESARRPRKHQEPTSQSSHHRLRRAPLRSPAAGRSLPVEFLHEHAPKTASAHRRPSPDEEPKHKARAHRPGAAARPIRRDPRRRPAPRGPSGSRPRGAAGAGGIWAAGAG